MNREEMELIIVDVALDHYWDSFTEVKDLIIAHIKGMAPLMAERIFNGIQNGE